MVEDVVEEWLQKVALDLQGAMNCISAQHPTPEHGAFLVQQAAEKLVKAAIVAEGHPPRQTHDIGALSRSIEDPHLQAVLATLARFSKYAVAFRYPGEEEEPVPTVEEVATWISEIRTLKTEFEDWLEERATERSSSPKGGSAEGKS